MTKSLNVNMGQAHEKYFTEVLGQRQPRGSGSQWRDQMDGRHNHLDCVFAYASDGKSTLKKSISVSLEGWKKAVEQSSGERPSMPIRFYADASLKVEADLILSDLLDFAEMREDAERWHKAKPILEKISEVDPRCIPVLVGQIRTLLSDTA